jgi:N-acetyl-gamma-glutamyl-phosphate reductase
MYSHTSNDGDPPRPPDEAAPSERPNPPVSARLETAAEAERRPGNQAPIRVAVVGATGYVGAELIRLLDRHPGVTIVGLVGRGRDEEPIGSIHPHLATTPHLVDADLPTADAVFLALPHGTAAELVPGIVDGGATAIDLGPDFRLRDPADYPRWYGFAHPHPELLDVAVYGLPELHRAELQDLRGAQARIVGAPGCYPTATLLALAPLARAGLIGDLVVDAKSGVSGAGREPKAELHFGEVNESVRAYGLGGHRHVAEIEQELEAAALAGGQKPGANPGAIAVDFVPHLIPMNRGILATCHIRPTRRVEASELEALYAAAYDDEPFVDVVAGSPATRHVHGSNLARVHVRLDERTGRILAFGVIDNLVKGAAGQAIQAFNIVHGLPETLGLEQHPLAP